MAYRVIMIENEVSIKVKLNNLIISKGIARGLSTYLCLSRMSVFLVFYVRTLKRK